MPRQRSVGRAPSRPTVPARTSTQPQTQHQTRPAATYAAPATQAPHQAPPTAQAPTSGGGSGLFGQMASTAAYVLPPSPKEGEKRIGTTADLDMETGSQEQNTASVRDLSANQPPVCTEASRSATRLPTAS